MALPITPNTTYSATDPVKSADLNDVQDQIVAFHGSRKIQLALSGFIAEAANAGLKVSSGNMGYSSGSGGGSLGQTLALPVGTRVSQVLVYVRSKAAAGNLTVTFYSAARTVSILSQFTEGATTVTGTGEAAIDLSSAPVTLAEDSRYYVIIDMPDENIDIEYVELIIDN